MLIANAWTDCHAPHQSYLTQFSNKSHTLSMQSIWTHTPHYMNPLRRSRTPKSIVTPFALKVESFVCTMSFSCLNRLLSFGYTSQIFILFGWRPTSTQSRRSDILSVATTISQLSALSVFAVVLIVFRQQIIEAFDSVGKLNAILKGSSILLTHVVILCEALRTRTSMRRVWQNLAVVDAKIGHLGPFALVRRRDRMRVAFSVVGYVVFVVATEITIAALVPRKAIWLGYWYATIFSLCANRLKHLQNVQLIDELASRYRAIRMDMEAAARGNSSLNDMMNSVRLFKEVTVHLHEINDDITTICCLSQLANLTQNFVQLSSDLYWLYGMIYRSNTEMLIGGLW